MDHYELLIKRSASKELEALPRNDRIKTARRIQELSLEPRPHGCEKLSAAEKYRIRQGNYRVVYSIDDEKRIVLIVKIGHRKDVYR
ncbi:MAG: mRNA interferase RelE/StbE [Blastocatellia bacterium]|nr:mRNA interferase RelE/StbE [Blastocatellia bacterium]